MLYGEELLTDEEFKNSRVHSAPVIASSPTPSDLNSNSNLNSNADPLLLSIHENGVYNSKNDVALYLHLYRHLPDNYMTKKQAEKLLDWTGGPLSIYAPDMAIGGDSFGNYEGILPTRHVYYECDINTIGAADRGSERLVYSDDGLIYYTGDHFENYKN